MRLTAGGASLGEAAEQVENPEHRQILRLLNEHGPMKPGDIAKRLNKDGANVRTWVNRMKAAGVIFAGTDGRYYGKPIFGMKMPTVKPDERSAGGFPSVR